MATATGGTISITTSNVCGTSATSSQAITVTNVPSTPGSISGPTITCSNTATTYSIALVNGATSYTWSLPPGWSGTSTTNSINAIVGSGGGNVTVTASNICGTSAATSQIINIASVFNQNISAVICSGDNYVLGTQTLTVPGTYTETFQTINGCDSVVNLTLNVNPAFNQNISATICTGDTYVLGTQTLSSTGTYSETFQTINGCDSTINLMLTVNPTYNQNISATICAGDTYVLGTQTLSSTGTYSEIFQTVNGCDSVVNLTLTVNTVNTTITVQQDTLIANTASAVYQWLDCNLGMLAITGETDQSFIVTANGDYAVIVAENGCTDTSTCVTMNSIGIKNNQDQADEIRVYPNPSSGTLTIEFSSSIRSIQLYDHTGKLVKAVRPPFTATTDQIAINMSEYANGIYSIVLNSNGHCTIKKVILQR